MGCSGTWLKTPSGKLYNVESIGIAGKNLIYDTANNHEIIMEYPSADYASNILNLVQTKIQSGDHILDLTTLKLPE